MALDYETGYLLEPCSAPASWHPSAARPLARFWRFAECHCLTAGEAEAWLAQGVGDAVAGVGGLQPSVDEARHAADIARIQRYIADGDCYQINHTFTLAGRWFGEPLALYARLRQQQPVRYGGFVGDAGQALLSLSPELFLERRGDCLLTRPMKGTAPSGQPAESLRESLKDRAENLMIVDLLRNDLGRIAELGSVKVDRLFAIEDYPGLRQMVSEVSARIPGQDFVRVLSALFPCGSITGAPKVRAMQIIGELEAGPRGIYTGTLGWLAPDGDFRLNVAIRTLELAAGGAMRLGIGSGIVADSQADAEWRECLLKADFLRRCDPGLRLIETMRLENGHLPRLAGHLERLQCSAAWFGFAFDAAAVRAALAGLPGEGLWRVRLTLGKAGDPDIAHFPLSDSAGDGCLAILSAQSIVADDVLRGHKTTQRAAYDAALAALPEGVFDVLFCNERGEIAEGARSNVFVERDGVLLTPPRASGALPGVLRAELLASGRAREAVLHPADLAAGFWLGNALRGLMPARLDGLA